MSIKLILHPGYNKCGSTSIQRYIHQNADLLEQQGVFISDINFRFSFDPPWLLIRKASPFFYFERMMESGDFSAFQKRVESVVKSAKRKNCKALIITAEGLGNAQGKARGKPIHEILSAAFDRVVVPIYIRKQDDYLLSSWQQWGHRQGESLSEHIDQALEASSDYAPDYLETAQYFSKFYGEQNIQVIPLVRKALKEGDLSADFCIRTGIEPAELRQVGDHVNKGLNPFICDILSRTPQVYSHVHDNSVKSALEACISNKEILYKKSKIFLSHEQRVRIMKHYESENRVLHEKYFKEIPFEDIFGIKDSPKDISERTSAHLEQLKDIVSLQMEMLLFLSKEKAQKEKSLKKRVRGAVEGFASFLYT